MMKVKEWVDGGLILDGDILKGAEEAFNDTRYVEAFALLHAFIDWWMIALYQLYEMKKDDDSYELFHKHEYRYRTVANDIEKRNIITQQEYQKLIKFDKLRNKIIHRLVMYSYQPYPRNKITKDQVTKGFGEGKELANMLEKLTDKIALRLVK